MGGVDSSRKLQMLFGKEISAGGLVAVSRFQNPIVEWLRRHTLMTMFNGKARRCGAAGLAATERNQLSK
jgi:hypothetical protein